MKATKILTAALAAAMLCASLSACGKTNDATETTAASGSDNKTTEKYTVLSEDFGAENYAIGFRRGDDALAKKVSDILAEMTADGKAGEIAKKWFGSDVMLRDPEYPRELNEEEGDASLQYILDKGELILGLDETFPPMGLQPPRRKAQAPAYQLGLQRNGAQRQDHRLHLERYVDHR